MLNFGDEVTGIDNFNENEKRINENGDGVWTTIGGLRLDGKPAKKGIYIHNGKKYIK